MTPTPALRPRCLHQAARLKQLRFIPGPLDQRSRFSFPNRKGSSSLWGLGLSDFLVANPGGCRGKVQAPSYPAVLAPMIRGFRKPAVVVYTYSARL